MKKVIGFLLMGALALSMAGCGSSAPADTDTADTASTGSKYIIATDTAFPPFEFTDASGNFVGIDVDIMAAIAEDQGFDYELQSLGFDAALAAVQSGQADGVIAGMSITEERKEKFDFSDPYYNAEVTIAVSANSDIASYDDLKGAKVAVKTGTNGADYAKSIADEYQLTITEFKDSPTMYQDVIAGNTAACFEDYPVMAYNIQQGAQLVIPEGCTAAGSDYGFAVQKGQNAELLEKFQAGLANIKSNGKYQEIVDKYTK
ncbi:MAG: transporter substrate-binding domain-containing protein [Candidatus Ornithomonoglobus sp.]